MFIHSHFILKRGETRTQPLPTKLRDTPICREGCTRTLVCTFGRICTSHCSSWSSQIILPRNKQKQDGTCPFTATPFLIYIWCAILTEYAPPHRSSRSLQYRLQGTNGKGDGTNTYPFRSLCNITLNWRSTVNCELNRGKDKKRTHPMPTNLDLRDDFIGCRRIFVCMGFAYQAPRNKQKQNGINKLHSEAMEASQ